MKHAQVLKDADDTNLNLRAKYAREISIKLTENSARVSTGSRKSNHHEPHSQRAIQQLFFYNIPKDHRMSTASRITQINQKSLYLKIMNIFVSILIAPLRWIRFRYILQESIITSEIVCQVEGIDGNRCCKIDLPEYGSLDVYPLWNNLIGPRTTEENQTDWARGVQYTTWISYKSYRELIISDNSKH